MLEKFAYSVFQRVIMISSNTTEYNPTLRWLICRAFAWGDCCSESNVLYKAWTHSWGRLGFRKGSLSAPFTAFVLRCFGSEFVVGAWELLEDGGFLLAKSFLCLSISSRCWFIHSCCLQMKKHCLVLDEINTISVQCIPTIVKPQNKPQHLSRALDLTE